MDPTTATATAVHELYESRVLDRHNAAARVHQHVQQMRLGAVPPRRPQTSEARRSATIPDLAWACSVRGQHHDFVVGPRVEVHDDFIFEGVWDGNYDRGRVHRSDLVFGSGARRGRYVVFVPPKHCWEHLYVLVDKSARSAVVSNSPVFALIRGGMATDGQFVRQVFSSIRESTDVATEIGFDRQDPFVVESERYAFYRIMFYNFMIMDGTIVLAPTVASQEFTSFSHYRQFLSQSIKQLAENAAAPGRLTKMEPITPLSSGYDSTAIAVLASELGYYEAVTQDLTIRGTYDSGQRTGAELGMRVGVTHHLLGTAPIERMGVSRTALGDISLYGEFLATAGMGDDIMLATMEEYLHGRMLLSGAMGDSVWRRRSTMKPGLPVGVAYGKSFTEFRLRVGYAFVPIPALGARLPGSIQRITRSPEMAPWTLWSGYDRPIPRRIAEEAGLRRGTFAAGKAAANPTVRARRELVFDAVEYVARRYIAWSRG